MDDQRYLRFLVAPVQVTTRWKDASVSGFDNSVCIACAISSVQEASVCLSAFYAAVSMSLMFTDVEVGAVGSSAGLRRWHGEEEFVVTAMHLSAGIVGIVWDVEVVVMPAAAVRWTVGRIRLSRRGVHSSFWGFVDAAYVESSGLGWGGASSLAGLWLRGSLEWGVVEVSCGAGEFLLSRWLWCS